MFQIYNRFFTTGVFFKFDIFDKDKFLKELKIQRIIGIISRIRLFSNIGLVLEERLKYLKVLLPEDYETYLPEYLTHVDQENHQWIQESLKKVYNFNESNEQEVF